MIRLRSASRAAPAAIVVAWAALAGCTSYKADVETICDSPKASGLEKRQVAPGDEVPFLLDWSDHNVHTPRGIALLASLRASAHAPADRKKTLEDAAGEVGLTRCRLADRLGAK